MWEAACKYAVDEFVADGMVVSLGSGGMVARAIPYLAEKVSSGELKGCKFVANSVVSASEAAFAGLELSMAGEFDGWDVALQEADEVDSSDLSFIFGRWEPSMPSHPQIREALFGMSKAARVVALVPSERCLRIQLGGDLPVVIEGGDAWEDVAEEVDDCVLGDAEIWRRPADGSQGPADPRALGNPYVTEDGENILDVR